MIRDARYDTQWGGTDSGTGTGTWFIAYESATEIANDLHEFMERMRSVYYSGVHLIEIKEKQRKRTIQDNRYKHIRYGVKNDYNAIYRHQVR